MLLTYLVRGDETNDTFQQTALPKGVKALPIGSFKTREGSLYHIRFQLKDDTIRGAHILAGLRDSLPHGADVRVLRDEASVKFCERLYGGFCQYERGLRTALTIALCAEQENFDNKQVMGLEYGLTLHPLGTYLFYDSKFMQKADSRIDSKRFSKSDLLSIVNGCDESTTWNRLFGNETMPTVREEYDLIEERRNDVMHFHTITARRYDETRQLLKTVNEEIETYIESSLANERYPRDSAENAKQAAAKLTESYSDYMAGCSRVLNDERIASLGRSIAAMQDVGSWQPMLHQMAGVKAAQTMAFQSTGIADVAERALQNMEGIACTPAFKQLQLVSDDLAASYANAMSTVVANMDTSQMVGGLGNLALGMSDSPFKEDSENDEPDASQEKGPDSEDPEP